MHRPLGVTRRTALGLLAGVSSGAWAQAGPTLTKPVRLVVAYPPGGLSDQVARWLAERLAPRMGVPVVVENKAGASGTLGVDLVVKAAPDGHTLGFAAWSPLTLAPHLSKLPYDPLRDITPVAAVMSSPVLILATSASEAKDFKGLLAQAAAKPGAVRWATSGPASLGHVMLEQIKQSTRLDITHVPYKGGGQQIQDALGGQFEILSVNSSSALLAHVKAGRLRALAVGAPTRLDSLPEVPTLAELGQGAANLSSQFGILAPAGLPPSLLSRWHDEIQAILDSPAGKERLLAADCLPLRLSAADFGRALIQEYETLGRVVRSAGIKEG